MKNNMNISYKGNRYAKNEFRLTYANNKNHKFHNIKISNKQNSDTIHLYGHARDIMYKT